MIKLYSSLSKTVLVIALLATGAIKAQTFGNEIQIPSVIDAPLIEIAVDSTFHDFDPNNTLPTVFQGTNYYPNNVATFGYNPVGGDDMTYLGPTLIWHHDSVQTSRVVNNLDEFTTVHWHGAHVPARDDGGPHQPIESAGGEWNINFTVMDDVTTLWYHPHLEDSTFIQVEKGLSGIIIVEDAGDTLINSLPHTYGEDDFPIIVQDRGFIFDSTSTPPSFSINTGQNGGPTVVINGVVNPYVNVGPQMVRFRVLDGSSRQFYLIGVETSNGTKLPIQLIGSDAGYLDAPVTVDSFATGPGIRNEFVMDLTGYADSTLYLVNDAATLKSAWPGKVTAGGSNAQIMEIRVGSTPLGSNPILGPIPSQFPTYPTFPVSQISRVRNIPLQGFAAGGGGTNPANIPFTINGNQFELNQINDTIKFDSTEEWHVLNESNAAHPFHIHDVHVDVLAVYDSLGVEINPMPAEYIGRQDNVPVPAGWQVDFVTTFADFSDTLWMGDPARTAENGYMYHCHILTHEDGYYDATNLGAHGMMQQFLVWNGVTVMTDAPESVDNFGRSVIFYPNPASDLLYLQGESKRASLLMMYDLAGKEIMRKELIPFEGIQSFDVSSFPEGMYLVKWSDQSNRTYSTRVALQR